MNQTVLESKKGVVSEISEKFTNSSSTVVAEYRGLSVAEVTELRRALRAEGAEMKVYKNTLASKAADADVVLLGPQVSFNLGKVKEQLPGKPVDAIEMRMYGRLDGKGVLALAKKMMGL